MRPALPDVLLGLFAVGALVVLAVVYIVGRAIQREAEALEVDPFEEPYGDA